MNLETIANSIKSNRQPDQSIIIGIEGFGGSGKSTIANNLANLLGNSSVVSIDDFIIKQNIIENDWDKQVFDRARLEKEVLIPARAGKDITYRRFVWDSNTLSDPINLPKTDYLIVEGISCYHPSIVDYYDYKIWVNTPIEIAKLRGQKRDAGTENEKHWDLWAQNDLAYQQKYHPDLVADFTVSN
jgi:uridine kinase